jgi:hypothetical protein
VKVKFRSDFYASLEGGMGAYMPRYGLMHHLACCTLFDKDPGRINVLLDGFLAVTPEEIRAAARKYLLPSQRAVLLRRPAGQGEVQRAPLLSQIELPRLPRSERNALCSGRTVPCARSRMVCRWCLLKFTISQK